MNILIIGASRGIGLEFVRQYAHAGAHVIATARSDGVKIDVALYVAGVWADGNALIPPTQQLFDQTMHANVLGAMQTIPQIAPLVEAVGGKFVFISSSMACIAEVENSAAWVYRVSKAALNMAVQSARFDYPKAHFMVVDPDWVLTDMGGAGARISAQESVLAMRKTIAAAKKSDANVFWHHDGRTYTGW